MKWIRWEARRWVRWLGAQRTPDCEELPHGHGVAWYDYNCRWRVSFPIPLNVVAGLLRTWWLEMKVPSALRDAYIAEGGGAGAWARGYHAGIGTLGSEHQRERERREYQRGYHRGMEVAIMAYAQTPVIQITMTREEAERAGIRGLPS